MKKHLLPEKGNFYKANLHVHTTISDGSLTPEEIKEVYKEKGYSVVAFTDHEAMVPHNDLNDDSFLSITAVELATNAELTHGVYSYRETCHMNLYSKDPNKTVCSVYSKSRLWPAHAEQYMADEMKEIDFKRTFTPESMNEVIAEAKKDGFIVSYNHPVWSLNHYPFYSKLKGVWGVEVYNTGCARNGYPDTVQPLDDLLALGERVFPLATDDAHGKRETMWDYFGGWVMIKADKLEYSAIMTALENGDFYSSTGPEISDLYIEDGVLTVKTSPASAIEILTERRASKRVQAKDGVLLNEAAFDLNTYIADSAHKRESDPPAYVRVTVTDEHGNKSYSRPYFINEL
ncbi:MAG: PHP domain-containing protein [Clostridia bacterium]|nr:PHP domain-containing protein [Clostridia bacterium]